MKLIKEIKEAEDKGREIVEQAKQNVAKLEQQADTVRKQQLSEAEQQRKTKIAKAITAAQADVEKQVAQMKNSTQQQLEKLDRRARPRMDSAVAKILDYLKSSL
ncbi:MAG: hypothetical protein ABIG61_03700 [Planctomycetota bacterium]